MSQIEQKFRLFLSHKPEIEKCYLEGLINRRSLARHLIKNDIAKSNQVEAVIAMLRRFDFKKLEEQNNKDLFENFKINVKDNILILDFEKDKELLNRLQNLIAKTNYDKGDTLKIVVGSSSITLFIDKEKEPKLKEIFSKFKLIKTFKKIYEISLQFPEKAIESKGIIAPIARELSLNDISITELLTANCELLIYLKDENVIDALGILKKLQRF
jgi:hypothetical protein